jgi:succinylglutamate desuccinylase
MSSLNIPNEYPVELIGPDIAAYATGNEGVPYLWSFEAKKPGPHVMITALVHGNEPCGAVALDWLLQREIRPLRGRLTLGFMNFAAYERFDATDPNASRWVDEDFNRLWAPEVLASERDSLELRRAREVQPVVASADFLLDIHSMQKPSPPLMMAGWLEKGMRLARMVGVPDRVIVDRGHAGGLRMRDHGRFGDTETAAAALLIECGQHWAATAGGLAKEATVRFLAGLGVTDATLLEELHPAPPPEQSVYQVTEAVTIIGETFTFAEEFTGGEVITEEGTLLGHDGGREVRTPYPDCMLVMPSKRLWKGQTAVRLAHRIA